LVSALTPGEDLVSSLLGLESLGTSLDLTHGLEVGLGLSQASTAGVSTGHLSLADAEADEVEGIVLRIGEQAASAATLVESAQ
jgi:hypothetical protein